MALASGRADKFVGLHFFNPVQLMKLVEVIKTTHTDPDVLQAVSTFGTKIGKSVVHCGDTPGFIVNRLLVPFLCQVCPLHDQRHVVHRYSAVSPSSCHPLACRRC